MPSPLGHFTMVTADSPDGLQSAIGIDTTTSESLPLSQTSPDHALSVGRTVQDTIIETPDTFEMAGYVSETPTGHDIWVDALLRTFNVPITDMTNPDVPEALGFGDGLSSYTPQAAAGPERYTQVDAALRDMRRRLWTLHTVKFGVLENMVLVGYTPAHNDAKGRRSVRLSFKRQSFAEATGIALPAIPRAKKLMTHEEVVESVTGEKPKPAPVEDISIKEKMRRAGVSDAEFRQSVEDSVDKFQSNLPGLAAGSFR